MTPHPFLSGFKSTDVAVNNTRIRAAIGGSGSPLLLLHGHPQTHLTWWRVASVLAERFTVVATDSRGYGDSAKPSGGANHINYSKRSMAQDHVEVMSTLGFSRYAVVGHDRGGRVAHRMALDHPSAVARLTLIDIVPTATMYANMNRELATRYYWWLFLIQPEPLPERLIASDPEFFLRQHIASQIKIEGSTPEWVLQEYLRCYRDPDLRHAICEDYRAAATIDLDHDRADGARKIEAPLLALWGARSIVGKLFDVLSCWRDKALDVQGHALDCGHTPHEELPDETLDALLGFLA